ncbi:Dps family protein [Streptomyces sp. NPDC088387]|uniref:Dps family protein n=1 Tax=Streptomyces sp. NPDC088387 TaxID=3365859 RepID=UPI003801CBCE
MTTTLHDQPVISARRHHDAPSPQASRKLSATVQGILVDLLELQAQAKQAHWNISGRSFRSLHLQLDEIASLARTQADTFAERLRALGAAPDGTTDTVARTTSLPAIPTGTLDSMDGARQILGRLNSVSQVLRSAHPGVDREDSATADLINSAIEEVDKQAWLLRDQVPHS